MNAKDVIDDLSKLSSSERAVNYAWFFKTGPGQYGEGDEFIGVNVPSQRQVAKKYSNLALDEIDELFKSTIHEHRTTASMILVGQYAKIKPLDKKTQIFEFYLRQVEKGRINNWDLVDTSAPKIIGDYLINKSRELLYVYAGSDNIWKQRIAIMTTFTFIRDNDYTDALLISEKLLNHKHDLIHKAVGWMLREIGNRDRAIEELFLNRHYKYMPRTMLRYAIEKFPENLRQAYLKGLVKN